MTPQPRCPSRAPSGEWRIPQRGQVWEYVQGSRQYRTLIVSNDEYNELPGAVAVIPRVLRCDIAALRRNLGFVTNNTMNAVERGLREFLNLP